MDISEMDPEDFADGYHDARREWGRVNQLRLEIETAGQLLTGAEHAAWLAAKARFDEYEQAWTQAYGMGVTIMVTDD